MILGKYETKCMLHGNRWVNLERYHCDGCKPRHHKKEALRKTLADGLFVKHVIDQVNHGVSFKYKDFIIIQMHVKNFRESDIRYLQVQVFMKNLLTNTSKIVGKSIMLVDELGLLSHNTLSPKECLKKEIKAIYDNYVHDIILSKPRSMNFVSLLLLERSHVLDELDEFIEIHHICGRGA